MKTQKKENRSFNEIFPKKAFYVTAVLLLTAFIAVACCDANPPTPPVEKFVVMFGIDQGGGSEQGQLAVKVDNKLINSPAEIEKGKTIVFTATHSKSWQISYWKVNGEIIRSLEPVQTFNNLGKHLDVRIAFKPWTPE